MISGQVKMVFVGDANVGKTSIIARYIKEEFVNTSTTVAASFLSKNVVIDNVSLSVGIWDTAGQERFHSLAPIYFRGSHASVIVYDVGDRKSFARAKEWLETVRAEVTEDCVIGLAGNKCDRVDRTVPQSEGAEFARRENILFFETSAKDNKGIDNMFLQFAQRLAQQIEKSNKVEAGQKISLDGQTPPRGNNNGGCGC